MTKLKVFIYKFQSPVIHFDYWECYDHTRSEKSNVRGGIQNWLYDNP